MITIMTHFIVLYSKMLYCMRTNRNQNLLSEINKIVSTLKAAEDIDLSKEDSFLLVYQTKKQKE